MVFSLEVVGQCILMFFWAPALVMHVHLLLVTVKAELWTGLWTHHCCIATSNSVSCNAAAILHRALVTKTFNVGFLTLNIDVRLRMGCSVCVLVWVALCKCLCCAVRTCLLLHLYLGIGILH